jgi:VWFA-related protein
MKISRSFSIVTLASVLVAPAVSAQEEPQVISETIDVRVVNVETVVTDRDGKLVKGLTAADFRLLVDGKETPIEYFSEISEGAAAAAAASADTEAPSAPVSPGETVGKSFLVFVDDSFSVASARDAVLKKLAADVALLGPADEMAVLAFDGNKIAVLADWTRDAAALRAALAKAQERSPRGHQLLAQMRSLEGDYDFISMAAETVDADVGQIRADLDKRISPEVRTQLGRTSTAMAAAVRGFVPGPGRRVMLILTGAYSLSAGAQLMGPMITAANRLGYTVYPVETASSDPRSVTVLDKIAQRTGGRVASSVSNEVLQQVVADTSSYYWLGFSPTWKADDRSHQVVVEVRRAGLKTRARAGFSDLSRRTELAQKAESALLFGGADAEKRLIVQLGEPKRAGRREIEVPVTLGVPVESLALTPKPGGYLAEAPLAVASEDEKGGRADLPTSRLQVTVKEVPPPGTFARFQLSFRVRNADQRLVFTVHDAVNGTALWGEAHVKPQLER